MKIFGRVELHTMIVNKHILKILGTLKQAKNSPKWPKIAIFETLKSDNVLYKYENVWETRITYHDSVLTHFENFKYLKIG